MFSWFSAFCGELVFVAEIEMSRLLFSSEAFHLNCAHLVHFHVYVMRYQPIYGFASGDPLRFKRAGGHKDLFYIDDKDVEFKEVRNYLDISHSL